MNQTSLLAASLFILSAVACSGSLETKSATDGGSPESDGKSPNNCIAQAATPLGSAIVHGADGFTATNAWASYGSSGSPSGRTLSINVSNGQNLGCATTDAAYDYDTSVYSFAVSGAVAGTYPLEPAGGTDAGDAGTAGAQYSIIECSTLEASKCTTSCIVSTPTVSLDHGLPSNGSVTITSVDATQVKGSFSVPNSGQDAGVTTGTFVAAICPSPAK